MAESIQDQKADEIDEALNLLRIGQKSENPIGGNAVTIIFVDGKDKAKQQLLSLIAHEKIESYKKGYKAAELDAQLGGKE